MSSEALQKLEMIGLLGLLGNYSSALAANYRCRMGDEDDTSERNFGERIISLVKELPDELKGWALYKIALLAIENPNSHKILELLKKCQ